MKSFLVADINVTHFFGYCKDNSQIFSKIYIFIFFQLKGFDMHTFLKRRNTKSVTKKTIRRNAKCLRMILTRMRNRNLRTALTADRMTIVPTAQTAQAADRDRIRTRSRTRRITSNQIPAFVPGYIMFFG